MDEYLIGLYDKGYSIDYITGVYYRYVNKNKHLSHFNNVKIGKQICKNHVVKLIYEDLLKSYFT